MTVVPYVAPNQSEIELDRIANPYLGLWWTYQTIDNIPDEAVGWLVSQGWQVTAMTYLPATQPPTPRYALAKENMQPLQVLLSLCNSYTIAANEARDANQLRYNQIVGNWKQMIYSTHLYMSSQDSQWNGDSGSYLAVVGNFEQDINNLLVDVSLQLSADSQTASAALTEMDTKAEELETNADANAETIEALLTAQTGYLSSFLSDFSSKLDELDTNYSAHLTQIQTLLSTSTSDLSTHATSYDAEITALPVDYTAHSITAPDYLDGLGETELARINEESNASLTVQLQDLIDKGLYTSAVGTDIYARNTRDRGERITQLNDSLNRQKLDNQHKLYEQQVSMRTQVMNGRDRLHQARQTITQWQTGQRDRLLEQVQQVETQQLAGIDKQHASQQEVSRTAMAERDVLFAQLQDAVKAIAASKERYSAAFFQQSSTLAEHKHRQIAETMNKYTVRMEQLRYVAQETLKLMQYQLEERNKLLIGLYSFVERREDEGPEWKDMAQLIAGLGDSGGGWLTP